jgi:uncharacterized BrkB/YihY/UPF0761 family membrane protein
MQFSLRTILVAMTAAAVYIGGIIGLDGALEQSYYGSTYFTWNVVSGLPTFVLWCVAGEWAFRWRRRSPAARLLLAAIVVGAAWTVLGMLSYVLMETAFSNEFVYTAFSVINNLVDFVTWLLFALAVVRTIPPPGSEVPAAPMEETLQPSSNAAD